MKIPSERIHSRSVVAAGLALSLGLSACAGGKVAVKPKLKPTTNIEQLIQREKPFVPLPGLPNTEVWMAIELEQTLPRQTAMEKTDSGEFSVEVSDTLPNRTQVQVELLSKGIINGNEVDPNDPPQLPDPDKVVGISGFVLPYSPKHPGATLANTKPDYGFSAVKTENNSWNTIYTQIFNQNEPYYVGEIDHNTIVQTSSSPGIETLSDFKNAASARYVSREVLNLASIVISFAETDSSFTGFPQIIIGS